MGSRYVRGEGECAFKIGGRLFGRFSVNAFCGNDMYVGNVGEKPVDET